MMANKSGAKAKSAKERAVPAAVTRPKATPIEMIDSAISKYFEIVDKLNSIIPYKRVAVWKGFFIKPERSSSGNLPGIWGILKDLYVVAVIQILLYITSSVVPLFLLTPQSNIMYALISVSFGFLLYLAYPLLCLLYSVLEYAVARAVGGKGNFSRNFAASTLPVLAVFIVMLPINIVYICISWLFYVATVLPTLLPCLCIVSLPFTFLSFLSLVYSYYLKYVALRKVHDISGIAAAAVVVAPVIIILIVTFAILALLAPYFAPIIALQQARAGIS